MDVILKKMKHTMPEILTANLKNASLIKNFLKKYRNSGSSKEAFNIPTACTLSGKKGKKLTDIKSFSGDEEVFIYWDEGELLRKDKLKNINEFWESREPWGDYDFCIFPESLNWCIGFTHNEYCVLSNIM